MKFAEFDYQAPRTPAEVVRLLAERPGEAKIIAGGQSLLPTMAYRLAQPALLVDLKELTGLGEITLDGAALRVGARTRWRDIEASELLATAQPLLQEAVHHIAHYQVRNRGTVGGSLVHADPSAELPLAAATLNATLVLQKTGGERRVAASDFFQGPMFTATAEDECLVAIEWPRWSGARIGSAFDETAIRHGDFAMASAAVQLQLNDAGVCERAVLGVGGVDGIPLALPRVAERLVGKLPSDDSVRAVAAEASRACEPGSDIHASAEYRRHLVTVLVERVLRQALATARNS